MAAMPSSGIVGTASRPSTEVVSAVSLWDSPWDEDDTDSTCHTQQRPRRSGVSRSVAPVKPTVTSTSESKPALSVVDNWEDEDLEELVANLVVNVTEPVVEAKQVAETKPVAEVKSVTKAKPVVEVKPLTDSTIHGQPIGRLTGKAVPGSRAASSKIEDRYSGTVKFFKGSHGWVTSNNFPDDLFLHKNDCLSGFNAYQGVQVFFRVEPDLRGKLKCVDVSGESKVSTLSKRQEEQMIDFETYMSAKRESKLKCKEQVVVSNSREQIADSQSNAAKSRAGTQERIKKGMQAIRELPHKARRDNVNHGNVSNDDADDWMQTRKQSGRAKLTRTNVEFHTEKSGSSSPSFESTAVGSASASVTDVTSELEVQDRLSVLDTKTKWADRPKYTTAYTSVASASRFVEIEMPEAVQSVEGEAASHQPPVADDWEDEEVQDALDRMLEAKRSEQTVVSISQDSGHNVRVVGVGVEDENQSVVDEQSAQCSFSLPGTESVGTSDPVSEPKTAPQKGALRQENERRATQGESRKHGLAHFLTKVGPEFDHAFVARSLGTDNLEELITRFTDIDDFESLVVAGMKPLLKNKLYRELALERKRRASKC